MKTDNQKILTSADTATDALSLGFRVDTVNLLQEIADSGLSRKMGILKIPLNVFKSCLAEVALRATELNDPRLNILMLKLALYEVPPHDIPNVIEQQIKARDNEHCEHPYKSLRKTDSGLFCAKCKKDIPHIN